MLVCCQAVVANSTSTQSFCPCSGPYSFGTVSLPPFRPGEQLSVWLVAEEHFGLAWAASCHGINGMSALGVLGSALL